MSLLMTSLSAFCLTCFDNLLVFFMRGRPRAWLFAWSPSFSQGLSLPVLHIFHCGMLWKLCGCTYITNSFVMPPSLFATSRFIIQGYVWSWPVKRHNMWLHFCYIMKFAVIIMLTQTSLIHTNIYTIPLDMIWWEMKIHETKYLFFICYKLLTTSP